MILNYFPARVLIAGGTGFTGERVAMRLRKLGVSVRVLTRQTESATAHRLRGHGCEIVKGDCTRRWTLWEALEGCQAVVSCAHIRYAEVFVQGCMRVGVQRLICLSSTRRYSRVECPSVGEVQAGEAAVIGSELEWTILRPTMIFGGEGDRNVSRIARWIRKRQWIPVFGDGLTMIQPVFVEDVVDTVVESLRRPQTIGKDYTLSGPKAMSYDELLRDVFRAYDREIRIVHIPETLGVLGARFFTRFASRYGFTEAAVLRIAENKEFPHDEAVRDLSFKPTSFENAIGMMVARTSEVDVLYVPVS